MPGPQEFLVIAVVALLVIGPERLPEAARRVAIVVARARAATRETVDELKRTADVEGLVADLRLGEVGREMDDLRTTTAGLRQEFVRAAGGTEETPDRPAPLSRVSRPAGSFRDGS